MSEEVSVLFEIMQTTRSMRRLKPDPVPAALIRKVLEAGTSAPSGGNMQRWRFLVVRDPEIKKTIGAYYKRAWDEVISPRYGRAIQRRAPIPSGSHGCSTRHNTSPITSTKLPFGSSRVCRAQTRPERRAHQSTRLFRTCSWPRGRLGSALR